MKGYIMNKYKMLLILEAAKFQGTGSMKKMQNTLTEAIENLKHDMFKQAKEEVLKKFRDLEVFVSEYVTYDVFYIYNSEFPFVCSFFIYLRFKLLHEYAHEIHYDNKSGLNI